MIKSLKLDNVVRLGVTTKKVNDERTTPQPFFDALNQVFKFTLDAAANQHNTKCERFLTDALNQSWDGVVFINPPYSRGMLRLFINRARSQSVRPKCKQIVVLMPADTSVKHFPWDADALCWLNFRLTFGAGDGGGLDAAPFSNVLAMFGVPTAKQIDFLATIGHGWVNDAGRVRLFGPRIVVSRV